MTMLLAFILVPLAELALLIQLGEFIGLWPTIGIVLGTGATGAMLLRQQGFATLEAVRRSLRAGDLPVQAVVDGLCLLVAGLLLLAPGLLTDSVGLLLFVPWLRRWFGQRILEHLQQRAEVRVYVNGNTVDLDAETVSTEEARGGTRPFPAAAPRDVAEENELIESSGQGDGPGLADSRWAPSNSKFRHGVD